VLQSSGRRTVCWSVEYNTCRRWPMVAGDGLRQIRADIFYLAYVTSSVELV